jgi:hypothetical protein
VCCIIGDTESRRRGDTEKRGDGETASNVIPDESAYGGRDPVSSKVLFFLDSPPQADFATSGMTNVALALKVPNFSAVC